MPLRLWLPLPLATQALTLRALPTQALPTQALTAQAPRAPGQNRDHENHPIARGQRALAAATPSMGVCRLRRAWQRRQW